jgi:hypothetical protein
MTDSSLVAALKDELRKIDAELAPLEEEVRRLAARVTPLADRRHWLEKTIEEASALFPDPAKAIAGASLAQQREGFIDNGCCVSCRSDGEQCANCFYLDRCPTGLLTRIDTLNGALERLLDATCDCDCKDGPDKCGRDGCPLTDARQALHGGKEERP